MPDVLSFGTAETTSIMCSPCRAALASFTGLGMQMGAVQQLAESASAAMAFGLDRRGDQERLEALSKRLGQLQQVPP